MSVFWFLLVLAVIGVVAWVALTLAVGIGDALGSSIVQGLGGRMDGAEDSP